MTEANVSPTAGSRRAVGFCMVEFLRMELLRLGAKSGDPLLVAFSGGPDSLALLDAAQSLGSDWPIVVACHVDHGLDGQSRERAGRALELARRLSVEVHLVRLADRPAGRSLEAWAREERYRVLERRAETLSRHGAWVLTAHHGDDQAETLMLRLLFGSGLAGLAGIRRRQGRILRPFLGLRRRDLQRRLGDRGLEAIEDPTNSDLKLPRSRIRRGVLLEWNKQAPDLVPTLNRVADRVAAFNQVWSRRWRDGLDIAQLPDSMGAELNRSALLALPEEVRSGALDALDQAASRGYPTSGKARREMLDRLSSGGGGGYSGDAGGGWSWQADSGRLRLLGPRAKPLVDFAYTLRMPGSLILAEIGLRLTVQRASREDLNAELRSSAGSEEAVIQISSSGRHSWLVRNRRPGDRIRFAEPNGTKKVKDLMIDHKVPRYRRSRIPVLVLDGQPVWVPGLALDPRYRANGGVSGRSESFPRWPVTAWRFRFEPLDSSLI